MRRGRIAVPFTALRDSVLGAFHCCSHCRSGNARHLLRTCSQVIRLGVERSGIGADFRLFYSVSRCLRIRPAGYYLHFSPSPGKHGVSRDSEGPGYYFLLPALRPLFTRHPVTPRARVDMSEKSSRVGVSSCQVRPPGFGTGVVTEILIWRPIA